MDDDEEEGESDIEDDMGKGGRAGDQSVSDGDDDASEQGGRVMDKGGVYKAPKLNAVAFEDA